MPSGVSGPVADEVSRPLAMTMSAFIGIACYNSLELLLITFRIFKIRRGLYFFSMLTATVGIPFHALPNILRFFAAAPNVPMCVLLSLGWWMMVTGQALMLWSRLHLVIGDLFQLRCVLAMIICVFLCVQVPTTIFFLASNAGEATASRFAAVFAAFEKVQLTVITAQEALISGVYMYAAMQVLGPMRAIKGPRVTAMIHQLSALFALVVALDLSLIVAQYTNNFLVQASWKPVVYSVKLKVEAAVLNNLMSIVRSSVCLCRESPASHFSTSKRTDMADPCADAPGAAPCAAGETGKGTAAPARLPEAQSAANELAGPSDNIYDGRSHRSQKGTSSGRSN